MLLDVMMPEMDGIKVCQEMRKDSQVPIIMISAKGEEERILGLDSGAEAYQIAKSIANTLPEDISQEEMLKYILTGDNSKYEMLLYERLTKADVWIVDSRYGVVTHHNDALNYLEESSFEPAIEKQIIEVFRGNITAVPLRERGERYLAAGAPIIRQNGEILGGVILHASIQSLKEGFKESLIMLGVSLVITMIMVVILIIMFSMAFTKPIKEIEKLSKRMAQGDYNVCIKVRGKDELDSLAQSMETLARRLEEARLEKERLEEEKTQFIAKISHELKTPVTVVRGTLELLSKEVLENKAKSIAYVSQMRGEILWLQKLIQDFLDLTKLQARAFQLHTEELDIVELMGDVLMSARILAKNKRIEIECEPPANEMIVEGDYDRLRQLFMILLDNAIKYSPEERQVRVIIDSLKGAVYVIDYGQGIKAEALEHIFNPYYRDTANKNVESTGLGLAIAAEIAKRHQIKILVESSEGKGSVFQVQFK